MCPREWRPFYLRELRDALRDMQLALPALRFNDLRVRFGAEALPDSALAMHDPRTRTLDLSIMTSGGTLAHELSHDLDWQTARRLFAVGWRLQYRPRDARTARSARAVGARLGGGATAAPSRPAVTSPPAADRPAELFARGADWFVATSLALQGRSNGFLTAVEDATLSGYAAGAPAAVGSAGVTSLIAAIEQMTYLPDTARAAFESQWADPKVIDPVVVVRRVLQAPVPLRGVLVGPRERNFIAPGHRDNYARPMVRRSRSPASVCSRWRSTRAHAAWRRGARVSAPGARGAWANGILGIAPWSPDDGQRVMNALSSAIAADVTTALGDQGVVPVVPAIFRSSAANCSSVSR